MSLSDCENNNKIILRYFQSLKDEKIILIFAVNIEKPKMSFFLEKTLVLSIICSMRKIFFFNKVFTKELFKEEESIEILKILGLIENI